MKKILSGLTVVLTLAAGACHAGGLVACKSLRSYPVWSDVLTFNAGDVGLPGAVYVGIHTPDKTKAAFLNEAGQWEPYTGGLYPIAKRFEAGVPASVPMAVTFPSTTTDPYVGWQIYIGYGVINASDQDMIRKRREMLNAAKPERVAQGRWSPLLDNDDHVKLAVLHKDLTRNQKYRWSVAVPFLDCDPDTGGK
ncbi:hypothetical protein ACPRNU_13955 [Chromobacterium vaccinii]|uniref:hypothetical protein n=1 Tax=Chromobacterium vaccinii TaxID=1108595 RepID=UPI003C772163